MHLYTITLIELRLESPMTSVSIRLSPKEITYLTALLDKKQFFPQEKEATLGKILKQFIKWCSEHEIGLDSTDENSEETSQKLLEQVHVSIPHILYLLRLHILMDSGKISDEVVIKAKQQAIDYINSVCGDFQHIEYNQIEPTNNEIGLNQIPMAKNHTRWKIE